MKVTTDGLPLQHLTNQCHLEAICNYNHPYLLINEIKECGEISTTPVVDSVFINPDILHSFASPNTRAIPIEKRYRNLINGVIVGRTEACDIQIAQLEISGKHAAFHSIGKNWYIEDLGSVNGTFVANERIEVGNLKRLSSQEMISFGGQIGCIFIEALDLQMLCSMLQGYWEDFNSETHTTQFKLPG